MRTTWPIGLAATLALAACTAAPGSTASTASGPSASAVIPSPNVEFPQPGVSPVPQFFDGWTGSELRVNSPVGLPQVPGGPTVTWRVLDRDREKGRIEGGHLIPTAPGGLTLEGQAGGRKGYIHFAVCEAQPTGVVGQMPYDPTEAPVALFPRPVIVRDPDVWARFWPGWSRVVHQASQTSEAFFPGMAPAVDFHTTALLFVDLQLPGYVPSRPVITHVDGSVIHLAMPSGAGEQPVVGPVHDPHLPRVRTYVFSVPTVPRGATVQFDAFPEAGEHPRVLAAEETDSLPFAVPSPGFNPPAGLTDVSYAEARTPIFRVHLPAEEGEFPRRSGREGTLRSMLMIGDRTAWSATATWTSITEQDAWADPVLETEAAAREAGTLAGPSDIVYWNGVTGYRIPRAGHVGGRPMTGATYVTSYEGRRVRFEVTAFSDVPQPERYAELAAAILADWRWR
jgi:hypothetical protein